MKTSPRTAFCANHEVNLSKWAAHLLSLRVPIVAISRKAPRLLELIIRERLASQDLLRRVTSERGAVIESTLKSEMSRVALCDDIIIHGSTFSRISGILQTCIGDNGIIGVPFAVGEEARAEQLADISRTFKHLRAEDCQSFVNSEVIAFGALGKPYDLDHPILQSQVIDGIEVETIDDILTRWANRKGHDIYRTDRSFLSATGSLIDSGTWGVLLPNRETQTGVIRKLRIYHDVERNLLSFVPMAPRSETLDTLISYMEALPRELRVAWNPVRDALATWQIEGSAQNAVQRTLVTWANYLLELIDLLPEMYVLIGELNNGGIVKSESLTVDQFDIQLLVGPSLAKPVCTAIDEIVLSKLPFNSTQLPAQRVSDQTVKIPTDYESSYREVLDGLLVGCDHSFDIIDAAFAAQHLAIEVPSRSDTLDFPDRLEFGVTFGYLDRLVNSIAPSTRRLDLHCAFDKLIDHGVIVPRYLKLERDDSASWIRALRVGEAQGRVLAHVTKELFVTLSNALKREKIPEVLFEKFAVLFSDTCEVFKDAGLSGRRLLKRGFHLYGARPAIDRDDDIVWLTDWALNKRILIIENSGGHPTYVLNERYSKQYNDENCALSPHTRREVKVLASWTAEAMESRGLGSDFLVALTTVESQEAYCHALRAELDGWLNHPSWGYTAALNAMDDYVRRTATETLKQCDSTLANLSNWHAQAQKKRVLRSSFETFIERADERWPSSSADACAATWSDLIKPAIHERSKAIPWPGNYAEETLEPIMRVVGRVSSLMRNLLSKFSGVHRDKSIPIEDSISRVSSAIQELRPPLRERFQAALPAIEAIAHAESLNTAIPTLRVAVENISEAAGWAAEIYPNLSSEPLDPLEPGLLIVFWDVRGSAQQPTREQLTRKIQEVNRSIKESYRSWLIEFDHESTDDGNALICSDFSTAICICNEIANNFAPEYKVKIALETNAQGNLSQGTSSGRLSGRAFEYAARLLNFYGEISKDSSLWIPDAEAAADGDTGSNLPSPPSIEKSYLLVSEEAFRLGLELGLQKDFDRLTRLPGKFKPRISGSIRRDLFEFIYSEGKVLGAATEQMSISL